MILWPCETCLVGAALPTAGSVTFPTQPSSIFDFQPSEKSMESLRSQLLINEKIIQVAADCGAFDLASYKLQEVASLSRFIPSIAKSSFQNCQAIVTRKLKDFQDACTEFISKSISRPEGTVDDEQIGKFSF